MWAPSRSCASSVCRVPDSGSLESQPGGEGAAEVCRPCLAGSALVRGNLLRLRNQGLELDVRAPRHFLKGLLDWCDGDRSLSEVATLAQQKWGASAFPDFLRAMLASGLLVDASTVALRALTSFSAAGHPCVEEFEIDWSVVCEPARWPRTRVPGLRDSGLSEALELVAPALLSPGHGSPDRAGAGLLRFFVFAPEGPSSDCLRGVCLGQTEGQVAVHARSEPLKWRDIYRAIANPESLRQVHALLVMTAAPAAMTDEGPRVRARRQLFCAGAALQRADDALRWMPFEVSQDIEFDAFRLSRLCGVAAHEIIGCASIRSPVPPALASQPSLKLRWMPAMPVDGSEAVTHVARAELVGANTAGIVGWGRSPDAKTACDIAVSEIVERYSYRRVSLPLTYARGTTLALSVDPRRWVLFADEQYANDQLGVSTYDPVEARHWVKGKELGGEGDVWLPAECIFSIGSLPLEARSAPLMRVTSSGCASDVNAAIACERAAYEVIERDAFLRHWLAQQPCIEVSQASLSADLAARVTSASKVGFRVILGVVQGDLGPVAVAGVTSQARGFFVLGSACAASAEESLSRALIEATVAAKARMLGVPRQKLKPSSIRSPDDHGNLYAQREHFKRALAIFDGGSSESLRALETRWPHNVKERLRSAGKPACWVDLSAAESPRALNSQRIHTVRVLIADTIPIAFGADAVPRGMARFVKRGIFPHPLA